MLQNVTWFVLLKRSIQDVQVLLTWLFRKIVII